MKTEKELRDALADIREDMDSRHWVLRGDMLTTMENLLKWILSD